MDFTIWYRKSPNINGKEKFILLTLKTKNMQIKSGGQLDSLSKEKKVKEIRVYNESGRTINLLLNDSSLSYLTLDEALDLRDELNNAISKATEVKQ